MNLVMPEKYNILSNVKKLLEYFYHLLWWSTIIYISITFYGVLVGDTLIKEIVWLILSIILCRIKPIKSFASIQYKFREIKQKGLNKFIRFSDKMENKLSKNK